MCHYSSVIILTIIIIIEYNLSEKDQYLSTETKNKFEKQVYILLLKLLKFLRLFP